MNFIIRVLFIVPILCTIHSPIDARFRLFSSAKKEKQIADSLKTIDSMRVSDSIRVADSCMRARYNKAYVDLVNERKQKAEQARKYAPVVPDPNERILSSNSDNISARSVLVDTDNPFASAVDSLQNKIDSLNSAIHDHDNRFRTMKTFPISEKKRYMAYLLQNNMKDTTAILAYCNQLLLLYNLKYELLVTIRNSQHANTKSFMANHIEIHRRKMEELSHYLVTLTPDVPFYPKHTMPEKL